MAAAVAADLKELRKRDPRLADSAPAASLTALAQEIDASGNSATSKSMCARALFDAWERLRELSPPIKEEGKLDELSARRAKRRERRADASG